MAPFVGKKPLSCRKSPRKIRESETGNFTKKHILKVTIGEPKAIIQDIFTVCMLSKIQIKVQTKDTQNSYDWQGRGRRGPRALFSRTDCTRRSKFPTHALYRFFFKFPLIIMCRSLQDFKVQTVETFDSMSAHVSAWVPLVWIFS